jgi:hypothetical protein
MKRQFLYLVLLQLLPALWFCRDFAFRGELLLSEEVLDMNYAWEKRLDEAGWNLEETLWDRNSYCGVPFLANPAVRALYPPSLFVRLLTPLSPQSSFSWLILFHLWVLGLGGSVWLSAKVRSLAALTLGGWLWSASGYVIVRTGEADPGFLYAIAWIPWILHFLRRLERPFSIPILIALGFLEVTAGRSDMTFFTAYFAAGYLFFNWISNEGRNTRRSLPAEFGALALVSLVSLLLCAPQILPTLELQELSSDRSGEPDFEFAATDSMYPLQFLLTLVPGCLGDSAEEARGGWVTQRWKFWARGAGFHEVYFYFGQGTLALALIGLVAGHGKERFYWAGLAVLVSLLAMGRYFPLFQIFFDWAPGWDRFRVPPRVLLGTLPAVSFLAATGLDLIVRDRGSVKRVQAIWGGWFLAMGVFCLVLTLYAPILLNDYVVNFEGKRMLDLSPQEIEKVVSNALRHFRTALRWALFWAFLPVALVWAGTIGKLGKKHMGWGLALVLLLDLCVMNRGFLRGAPAEDWSLNFPEDPLIDAHKETGERGRILVLGYVLQYERRDAHPWFFPGRLLAYDVEMVQGYTPFLLKRFVQAFEAIAPKEPAHNKGILLYLFFHQSIVPEVFRYFNVSNLLAPEELPPPYEPIGEKVYVGKRSFTSKLWLYKNPYRHPRVFLFDSGSDAEYPSPNPDLGAARIVEAQSNRLAVRAEVKNGAKLALLETWYPGWKCWIDGAETTVERTAKTFRSVAIPEGEHEILFEYRPESWRNGVALFFMGFAIWVGTAAWSARNRRILTSPDRSPLVGASRRS